MWYGQSSSDCSSSLSFMSLCEVKFREYLLDCNIPLPGQTGEACSRYPHAKHARRSPTQTSFRCTKLSNLCIQTTCCHHNAVTFCSCEQEWQVRHKIRSFLYRRYSLLEPMPIRQASWVLHGSHLILHMTLGFLRLLDRVTSNGSFSVLQVLILRRRALVATTRYRVSKE